MPRFFVEKNTVYESEGKLNAAITGNDANHITRSLRMRVGEEITLCDGDGTEYYGIISEIETSSVKLTISHCAPSEAEAPYKATVYQALAKGDKFDTVIQKSVECGAFAIVPVATSRCTVKLSAADAEKKRARWQRIAEEAAKQCGRGIIPQVKPMISLSEVPKNAENSLLLFCYEKGTKPLKDVLAKSDFNSDVSILIGPEGGFAEDEADFITENHGICISLGKRILRTESAAPFVLACLSYAFES